MNGQALSGTWIDRSAQYRAHLRKESTDPWLFSSVETLELSPIPCWDDLSETQRQTKVRRLVKDIEQRTEEAQKASTWLDQINRCRSDAHAKSLHPDDLSYLRVCFLRMEELLEIPHE